MASKDIDGVYVYYPRGKESGGPEALHQLVDSLRRQGCAAWLVPYPGTSTFPRTEAYSGYDAPEVAVIPKHAVGRVVVPESQIKLLTEHRGMRGMCWWLSIDSSYAYGPTRVRLNRRLDIPGSEFSHKMRDISGLARSLVRAAQTRSVRDVDHLVQSQFAWAYLATRLPSAPSVLSDYSRISPPTAAVERDATLITYNAIKAERLTRPVVDALPQFNFVGLANMSRDQVDTLLAKSSLYLDLGSHPGKDRMPREAALLGTPVAVAMRGSAAFSDDVPIPRSHKIPMGGNFTSDAVATVDMMMQDPRSVADAQSNYRQWILNEKGRFDSEVRRIFIDGVYEYDAGAFGGDCP